MIKQCSATKAGGEQCRRTASEGSDYCHSHRHFKPVRRPPPTVNERTAEHFLSCSDCGHLISPGQAWIYTPSASEERFPLCEPCLRLRYLIEARIMEIIEAAPNQTLTGKQIFEDLERFGVDEDLVKAARLRMHADGRLVSTP
jgi:hypothetical protein